MTQYVGSQSSSYPYSAVVYIEATYLSTGHTYTGSGVVVGENDVLTAAHVVYEADEGGIADIITVYPAKDGYSEPFGGFEYDLVNYFAVDNDSNGLIYAYESERDIAILGFDERIGDLTGWMDLDPATSAGHYHLTGYPGIYAGAGGVRMMDDVGYVSPYYTYDLLDISSLEVNNGNSGGPVWSYEGTEPTVSGIVSTGSWAVEIAAQYATLTGWISANDYLIGEGDPPAEAIDDYGESRSTAGSIGIGDQVTGTIEVRGDEDWFAVQLQGYVYYRIDLMGDSTSSGTLDDPFLAGIYDSNLTLLSDSSDDDSGTGRNSRLIFLPQQSGLYYLAAAAYAADIGTYRLQVQQLDDYAGAAGTLGSVAVDDRITGSIDVPGDEDWFRISLTGGDIYQIDLEGEATSRGTLHDPVIMGIYAAAEHTFLNHSGDDDGGSGLNSRVEIMPAASGDYYVVVGSADGGLGRYTLSVAAVGGLTLSGTSGSDVLTGESGRDTIFGLDGDDYLQGGAGDDYLQGGAGNDTFDEEENQRGGADTLVGGPGDDVYYLDSTADSVIEQANEGTDLIRVGFSCSLAELTEIENLAAISTSADLMLTGNDRDNQLSGSRGDDRLNGGDGDDYLEGGAGNDTFDEEANQRGGVDTLVGGPGDDVYYLDSTADSVIEQANEGTDLIRVDFSCSLAELPEVEDLAAICTSRDLLLTGNDRDNQLTGSGGDDGLIGGAGDDVLYGNAGNDIFDSDADQRQGVDLFYGGAGDDIFFFDCSEDNAVEFATGGEDTIRVDFSFSLRGHGFIENLWALETQSDLVLIGHNSSNRLTGSNGNDLLDGGPGDDVLNAGAGNDECIGGSGDDWIDGGDGLDFALFTFAMDAGEVSHDGDDLVVRELDSGEIDRLANIERLVFSDMNLAFDLDGRGGQAAKLIGAVFGPDAATNRDYIGIALDLLDSGASYEDLAIIAFAAIGSPDSGSLIATLWANLFDEEVESAELEAVQAFLDHGMSLSELIVAAADSEINQSRIDLIGLAQSGLAYLPQ